MYLITIATRHQPLYKTSSKDIWWPWLPDVRHRYLSPVPISFILSYGQTTKVIFFLPTGSSFWKKGSLCLGNQVSFSGNREPFFISKIAISLKLNYPFQTLLSWRSISDISKPASRSASAEDERGCMKDLAIWCRFLPSSFSCPELLSPSLLSFFDPDELGKPSSSCEQKGSFT